MGWFDEQLRYRKEQDDRTLNDAIEAISGAVMGKRLTEALDNREIVRSAIDEVLKFYHCKAKSDVIPPQVTSVDEQLDYRMRPFGILRRTVTLEEGWYHSAIGAMLGTLKEDGSAIALIPGRVSGYTFLNLKTGKRTRLTRKTANLIDTEALCFYQPLPQKPLTIADLLKFMIEQLNLSDLMLYFGMMALSTLLGLLSPMFTQWLFGDVLSSGSLQVLYALAAFMLSYSVSRACFTAFQSLVNARITIKQSMAVEAAVMNRIMSLSPSFFKDYAASELSQKAQYVQMLCSKLFSSIGITGLTSIFSLVYIGQIYAYAPKLATPSLIIMIVIVLHSMITTLLQMNITRQQMELSAKTSGLTYATISGIQKIKLAGAEKRMFSRWARQYAKEAQLEYNPPMFLKLSSTISLALSITGTMIMYAIAVKSGMNIANYYAFTAAYGMVSSSFMSLSSIASTIAEIRPTLDVARPILEATPEMADGKEIITELGGFIELSHVSFRYNENMPNVIDDLSLKIAPGSFVAIVGSTGCGKSTLMRLMLGFEKPQKGTIYYDQKDISRIDLQSLRRRIGTVMQDGRLFVGDIYSNIVIAAPQLTLDQAWEAAEIACAADDIRAMPMGMHTIISEGQGGISGGQRQRLLIARAIAPKPGVLFFDEATSALDNITQKKISDAIDALDCTRVVIAHRLSTIQNADKIIYLDHGKIAEQGTYEELIEKNGLFAALVERQRLDID